jgi:hypothetical protein
MNRRVLVVLFLAVASVACQSAPGTTIRSSGGPNPDPTSVVSLSAGGPERGVIKGVVTDEQGDPVVGAAIRLTGYTADFNGNDEDLLTDASGLYRVEVPDGLYEVFGTATVTFEGAPYVLDLRPVDEDCEAQESSAGIVKDLVLELSGLDTCFDYVDPENPGSYNGGSVNLLYARPRSLPADTQLEFTLEPVGPLADGSTGPSLTFQRTALALETTFGPLEETNYLEDIPLARYRISGTATLPDGTTQALRFAADPGSEPADAAEFGFVPYAMLPYGIRARDITVVDADWLPSL